RYAPRRLLHWGIFAALCIGLITGGWAYRKLRDELVRQTADHLARLRDTQVVALRSLLRSEISRAEEWATRGEIRQAVQQLVSISPQSASYRESLANSPARRQLRASLRSIAGDQIAYLVWNRDGNMVANWLNETGGLGCGVTDFGAALLAPVFRGETVLRLPDGLARRIIAGPGRYDPHFAIIVPVLNGAGEVIAAMLVRNFGIEQQFADIVEPVRFGGSGECYAFDERGFAISEIR